MSNLPRDIISLVNNPKTPIDDVLSHGQIVRSIKMGNKAVID